MTKRQSELRGMKVVGASGRTFGVVDDLILDLDSWRVTDLVVRVNSEAVTDLGLQKPFWSHARLEIPVHQISGATEIVVLRSTLEEFAQLIALAAPEKS